MGRLPRRIFYVAWKVAWKVVQHSFRMEKSVALRALYGAMVVLTLFLAGCASQGSTGGVFNPFAKSARDESLRKQVEADSFPTAQQAGL